DSPRKLEGMVAPVCAVPTLTTRLAGDPLPPPAAGLAAPSPGCAQAASAQRSAVRPSVRDAAGARDTLPRAYAPAPAQTPTRRRMHGQRSHPRRERAVANAQPA